MHCTCKVVLLNTYNTLCTMQLLCINASTGDFQCGASRGCRGAGTRAGTAGAVARLLQRLPGHSGERPALHCNRARHVRRLQIVGVARTHRFLFADQRASSSPRRLHQPAGSRSHWSTGSDHTIGSCADALDGVTIWKGKSRIVLQLNY